MYRDSTQSLELFLEKVKWTNLDFRGSKTREKRTSYLGACSNTELARYRFSVSASNNYSALSELSEILE